MIGKTIKAIEESRYGDELLLRFTDGTAAVIQGHSYEDVDLSVTELDTAAYWARVRERVGKRESKRVRSLVSQTRAKMMREEEEEMKRILSPGAFEIWVRRNRPGRMFARAMRETWEGAMTDRQTAMNRQVYGQRAEIPIKD